MKKISDLVKPYLSIIFGALLFLFYFNLLGYGGISLAVGIIIFVLALMFMGIGILSVALGDKFPKNIKPMLDVIGIGSYAFIFGAMKLIILIVTVKNDFPVTPIGWVLYILVIISGLALGGCLIGAYFAKSKALNKLTQLLGAIFVLCLLLDVLSPNGAPAAIGEIVVLQVVLYAIYVYMLFSAFSELNEVKAEPKKVEEKNEEAFEKPKENSSEESSAE